MMYLDNRSLIVLLALFFWFLGREPLALWKDNWRGRVGQWLMLALIAVPVS
jgi:hypothetical protein